MNWPASDAPLEAGMALADNCLAQPAAKAMLVPKTSPPWRL
jgi:hypothetical protein